MATLDDLEAQLIDLEAKVETLEQAGEDPALRQELDKLRDDIDLITAGALAPDVVRGPWNWSLLDDDQARTAWDILVPWVYDELLPVYDPDSMDPRSYHGRLAPCWFAHRRAVQMLGDLWFLHRESYYELKSGLSVYNFSHRDAPNTLKQLYEEVVVHHSDESDQSDECPPLLRSRESNGRSRVEYSDLRNDPAVLKEVREAFIEDDVVPRARLKPV